MTESTGFGPGDAGGNGHPRQREPLMSHRCPAPGCRTDVDDGHFLCAADWRRLPNRYRQPIIRAWQSGRGVGTPALAGAHLAALRALAEEENQ